uniref:Interferon-induced protein with tetratricopeptide repeats 5-like n=1 Tax=Pogona vitticeps TaxID=103695 RepID=A0A6J0UHY8_9SAUR
MEEKDKRERCGKGQKGPGVRVGRCEESETSNNDIKKILLQLECHFTWTLRKENVDPDELEQRILDQIEFLPYESKVQNYNLLGFVKYLNGKKEDALDDLKKAEEAVKTEHPEDIEKHSLVTWGNYAWLFYHMGNMAEAQTYINKTEILCKRNKSTSPYKMKLPHIYCEKAWALLKFGANNHQRAKESFVKALEEEPNNPEFNAGYAIAMYRLEDHDDRKSAAQSSSLEPLRRAVQLNPDDPCVLPLLALKLQETDNAEEGEKYMEESLAKHPDLPHVLRYAAKFYRKKGEVQTALKYLTKALRLTPNSGFLHHQVGLCYRAMYFDMKKTRGFHHQPTEEMKELLRLCILHFQTVIEHKTKFFFAHLDLANIYAEGGKIQEAEEMFQRAFGMKKLTNPEKQWLHFCYGRYQQFHKKSDSEAMKHFLEGLKIEHESSYREKCKDMLKKLIEKRIKKGPADAKSLGILGFIHQLDGEKRQAIECYERALKMDPGNEEYLSAISNLRLSLQN